MRPLTGFFGFGFVAACAFAATFVRALGSAPIVPEAVASVPPPPVPVHADGRVVVRAGKQVTLSAEMLGRLVRVDVVEGQRVAKGELLAELDGAEYAGALREALGAANEAYARLRARRDEARRSKTLVESGALPLVDAERARDEQSAARARLSASSGAASRVRALLAKTRVVAPIEGVVISRFVQPAETVSPGTPLFVIADLSERRVEAEVDEFDVGRIALGAPAEVRADGLPGQLFAGTVEEIPSALSARKVRPQDPSRPLDTSVLAVKVTLPRDTPLKLGQRVAVAFPPPQRQ